MKVQSIKFRFMAYRVMGFKDFMGLKNIFKQNCRIRGPRNIYYPRMRFFDDNCKISFLFLHFLLQIFDLFHPDLLYHLGLNGSRVFVFDTRSSSLVGSILSYAKHLRAFTESLSCYDFVTQLQSRYCLHGLFVLFFELKNDALFLYHKL